jgi:hypothetical protein
MIGSVGSVAIAGAVTVGVETTKWGGSEPIPLPKPAYDYVGNE